MKSKAQIRKRLRELLADERIHYKPATVQINAPLALVQADLAAQIKTLEWVLGEPPHLILKG